MPVNIYLLSLTDLKTTELMEEFLREAPLRVDEVRRRKAEKIRNPKGRAVSLGAGLLLQKMAADYQWGIKNSIGNSVRTITGQHCTVRQQCYTAGELMALTGGQISASAAKSGQPSRQMPLPLQYRFGAHGKPEIVDFPMRFSLSHSGDYVLCACSGREIGADIQQLQTLDYLKLAGRFFTKEEYEALKECSGQEEKQSLFFRLWTRKEACGKLTGQGITGVLNRDVRLNPEWLEIPAPEGYAAAVCIVREECPECCAGDGMGLGIEDIKQLQE